MVTCLLNHVESLMWKFVASNLGRSVEMHQDELQNVREKLALLTLMLDA